ncbi:hypothetical protein J437_LFUL011479 [Ladona fulva]|uniref:peptidylprolyl isomerase n=1 Tax=Ladona fulva TaxID=123851 RepID=A0A8K0KC30_LADFU|nr:hypothetical protein J437_LFUL011479 [Ladona fulva]
MENKFSSPLIIDSEDTIVIKAEDSIEVAQLKRKISARDDLSEEKIRRKAFELANRNEIEVRLPFEANLESAHFKDISSGLTSEEDAANTEFPHVKSSEDLSLKELLSDVIEFEKTPKGVAVHKIKPRISIRDRIGNISGTMSFKELLSDVMQLEQTPYEGVIPPRKYKSESFKSHQTPSKKRNTFTLQMKINLLNELDSGVKLTKVAKKYDVPISTLSTIYRDRHKVRSAESMIGGGRKRIRMGAYQNVDEEVLQWYWNETREGRKPNGPQIQEKAREIAHLFGEKNFEGSAGWLKCFKDRYGLSKCRNSSGNESGHEAPENINSEVGLARANVCMRSQSAKRTAKDRDGESFDIPNRSALTQDLKSKGGGLRRVDTVGDLVEVRYIARVLDDAVLHGEVIDSNEKDDHPLCLKVKEWWKTWKEEESNLDISDGEDRRWWEGALWGATVGTRRMIVVPPEIGLKVKLSPDACLVYEVEVLQIRRGIGVEESKHGQTVGDAAKMGKSIMSNAREQEGTPRKMHMPGCSLSSVVTSTPSGSPPVSSCLKDSRTPADKASILSRMARMGQPTLMLPDLQARRRAASEGDDGTGKVSARSEERSSANEEDSADVEVELEDGGYILPMEVETMPMSAGNRPPPPRLQPRPIGVPQVQPPYQSSVYWHSPPQYSNVPTGSSYTLPSRPESTILGHSQQHQQYSYPSHSLALTGPSAVPNQPAFQDPHLSVFLSETRTQNAELRMAMGRLTDKVDAIMGKVVF